MKLQQLRYYCETYDRLNITKAANALFVSPPAVSGAIHELEKEFGFELFHRNNNLLTPTPEGRLFYSKAKGLLKSANQFEADMHAVANGALNICIGTPPLIGSYILPRFTDFESKIRDYKQPISFSTVELPVPDLLPKLESGQIDAFIANSKSADFSQCQRMFLCKMPFYVLCHKNYPLAKKKICMAADLLDYQLLMSAGISAPIIIKDWFRNNGYNIEYGNQYSQLSSVENLLLKQQGYFISSDTTPLYHPDLVQIPLVNPPYAEVYIFYLHGKTLGKSAIEFLKFITTLPF